MQGGWRSTQAHLSNSCHCPAHDVDSHMPIFTCVPQMVIINEINVNCEMLEKGDFNDCSDLGPSITKYRIQDVCEMMKFMKGHVCEVVKIGHLEHHRHVHPVN